MSEHQLSHIETVQIISTFFSMADNNFNCASCLKRHTKEKRDTKKGCNSPLSTPVAKYNDYVTFYRCPGALRSGSMREVIDLHRQWEQGILPFEGGLLDQPAKFIEAMKLVDALKFEHQKDLEEKAKKQWQTTKSASNYR